MTRILVVVALTLGTTAPVAFAAGSPTPPPGVSAVSQYVEVVPTSGGGVATSGTKQTPKPLPKKIAETIRSDGGSSAHALATIATSAAYGAPSQTLSTETTQRPAKPHRSKPTTTTPTTPKPSPTQTHRFTVPKPPSAFGAAISSISGARLIGLVVALVLIASTLVGTAARQRPQQR